MTRDYPVASDLSFQVLQRRHRELQQASAVSDERDRVVQALRYEPVVREGFIGDPGLSRERQRHIDWMR